VYIISPIDQFVAVDVKLASIIWECDLEVSSFCLRWPCKMMK